MLFFDGIEERPHRADLRLGKSARAIESEMARQRFQSAAQRSDGVGELGKSGIASHFRYCTHYAHGAELFQDIRIPQDHTFDGGRLAGWLMRADGLANGWNLLGWKAQSPKNRRCMLRGVGDVIPSGELFRIFRALANEHAQIVQPGRRANHVVIVLMSLADLSRKRVEAGLVPELVDRSSDISDVIGEGLPVTCVFGHRYVSVDNHYCLG